MMGRMRKQWSRHLGWYVLLAVFMQFMQQAGWRHALQHATRDEGTPTHTVCLVCLAHHASDASVAPIVPSVPLATFDHVLTAHAAQPQCGQGAARCYQPRAPPWVFST